MRKTLEGVRIVLFAYYLEPNKKSSSEWVGAGRKAGFKENRNFLIGISKQELP